MELKLLVLALFVAVLVALFSGLIALMKGGHDEATRLRLVKSLTWRVALSLALFILLVVTLRSGLR